ncbi:MAG: hypothetical protein ABJE47_11975 [bacterium]
MAHSSLRPRTVTELVDAAFQILRAHYAQFVVCSAVAYVPFLIIRFVVIGDPKRFMGGDITSIGNLSHILWTFVAAGFGGWLTYTIMDSVLIVCASQAYLGEEVDAGKAIRRAVACLPRVLVAGIVWFGFLCIGFMALLVGAIYVGARCFAVVSAIVLEDTGPFRAFGRSSELSKGRKRHILNALGLVVLIYWIVAVGVSTAGELFGSFALSTLISSVAVVLVYPVVAITETLLYYDARIQGEGLDIELMAQELGIANLPDPLPR